jgi:hypothetical protein
MGLLVPRRKPLLVLVQPRSVGSMTLLAALLEAPFFTGTDSTTGNANSGVG